MRVEEYRTALSGRTNKTANRIRCPKCSADDACYRLESGMKGLSELNADGVGQINPRRPNGGH